MQKNEMDKSGLIIIKICVFSIVLSLTALLLCGVFNYFTKKQLHKTTNSIPRTIIIDAGHGGEDGGATSLDGTKEKDLNLSVALNLGNILESNGYSVVYTRTDDTMLYTNSNGSKKMQDLSNRLKIAKKNENAIFISIHMNKFSQAKYSGLQVFYSCNNKQSETLAKIIQSNTQKFQQNENNRETKMAGSNIYLLHNIKNPAVLVECGFLSNQEECEKLKNEIYRKEIALVIYSSIIEFFEKI
jgi:N-acetylmuramoyl-L-alanine amidase